MHVVVEVLEVCVMGLWPVVERAPKCCIRAASVVCRNNARVLPLRDRQQPRD